MYCISYYTFDPNGIFGSSAFIFLKKSNKFESVYGPAKGKHEH